MDSDNCVPITTSARDKELNLLPSTSEAPQIKPADGKLGILIPGMGAVATTFIAGVEAIKAGIAKPIGSITQMNTIRLGKRTDNDTPKIKDFVPLAGLNDLEFAGWDIFQENCYDAALHAGVLEKSLLEQVKAPLQKISPMPAVFDSDYVKRINGPNRKKYSSKMEAAEAVMDDIRKFKERTGVARMAMIWCGSTEVFHRASEVHATLASFEKGSGGQRSGNLAQPDLRVRGIKVGRSVCEWRAPSDG